MPTAPPLTGLRVLELAGLAPAPFTGLLLADAGATVLRIDRTHTAAHTSTPPPPTPDLLVRHKSSIALNLKNPRSIALFKSLAKYADVVIDPFRPGVLEKLGLGPDVLHQLNERLILVRVTGYRRSGKYRDMAGHDINYLAVSGVLSMLGEKGQRPSPPGNILGDFAGGGHVAFTGVLLALLHRERTGKGQVVEANMVDGASYLNTFPRLSLKTPMWSGERGTNLLDGAAPFYGCYKTRDGKWMSVGALEPQFFEELLKGLGLRREDWPEGRRLDKKNWGKLQSVFKERFKTKTRREWEDVFDRTDACVAPVLEHSEMERAGYDQRPIVGLTQSPLLAIAKERGEQPESGAAYGQGVEGEGWTEKGLRPGVGGEEVVIEWLGWKRGQELEVEDGALTIKEKAKL